MKCYVKETLQLPSREHHGKSTMIITPSPEVCYRCLLVLLLTCFSPLDKLNSKFLSLILMSYDFLTQNHVIRNEQMKNYDRTLIPTWKTLDEPLTYDYMPQLKGLIIAPPLAIDLDLEYDWGQTRGTTFKSPINGHYFWNFKIRNGSRIQ